MAHAFTLRLSLAAALCCGIAAMARGEEAIEAGQELPAIESALESSKLTQDQIAAEIDATDRIPERIFHLFGDLGLGASSAGSRSSSAPRLIATSCTSSRFRNARSAINRSSCLSSDSVSSVR